MADRVTVHNYAAPGNSTGLPTIAQFRLMETGFIRFSAENVSGGPVNSFTDEIDGSTPYTKANAAHASVVAAGGKNVADFNVVAKHSNNNGYDLPTAFLAGRSYLWAAILYRVRAADWAQLTSGSYMHVFAAPQAASTNTNKFSLRVSEAGEIVGIVKRDNGGASVSPTIILPKSDHWRGILLQAAFGTGDVTIENLFDPNNLGARASATIADTGTTGAANTYERFRIAYRANSNDGFWGQIDTGYFGNTAMTDLKKAQIIRDFRARLATLSA